MVHINTINTGEKEKYTHQKPSIQCQVQQILSNISHLIAPLTHLSYFENAFKKKLLIMKEKLREWNENTTENWKERRVSFKESDPVKTKIVQIYWTHKNTLISLSLTDPEPFLKPEKKKGTFPSALLYLFTHCTLDGKLDSLKVRNLLVAVWA